MTSTGSVAPTRKRPVTLEELVFALDRGELSPEDRAAWEPYRVRLVRQVWQLVGAIGLSVSALSVAVEHLRHPALGYGLGNLLVIAALTLVIGPTWASC
jgi:hypothetical protein